MVKITLEGGYLLHRSLSPSGLPNFIHLFALVTKYCPFQFISPPAVKMHIGVVA